MAFDTKAFLDACSPPTLIHEGQTYVGKVLSFQEMLPLQEEFDKIQASEAGLGDIESLTSAVCDKIGIPKEIVLALPPGGVLAALQDFLESLMSLNEEQLSQMNGSDSPPKE